jgi:lysophospholipase L1-like esterase
MRAKAVSTIVFTCLRMSRRFAWLDIVGIVAWAALVPAIVASLHASARDRDDTAWIGTWAASPQPPEPPVVAANPAEFDNQTLRQVIHATIGGRKVRVRFSNEYGATPLRIGAVTLAQHAKGAALVPGTERTLTFAGRSSFEIPARAPALSDSVDFDVAANSDLVISIFLPEKTPASTFHQLAVATTYVSTPGDRTSAVEMPVASTTQSWFFLTGVSVEGSSKDAAIVTFGDSITDGYASTPDTNRRWPDVLAERLRAERRNSRIGVLNEGISGNRTQFDYMGPSALARLDRDVLGAPGVKFVILLEGINNIGFSGAFDRPNEAVSAEDIIASEQQIVDRAHQRGLKIYGATLTPFEGTTFPGYFTAEGEQKRQAVNRWIRESGAFDAVIDFDMAVRDPAQPSRMLPAYDSGDHLHPNDAGYDVMGKSIDLDLFR